MSEDLLVRVDATTADLERGFARGERAAATFSERIRDRIHTASAVFTGLNQGIELVQKGIRGAERVWDASFGRMIERGEQLQAWSRRFNAPVEEISRVSYAAQQAGVDFGELGLTLARVQKALADTSDQGGEATRIFSQGLGLTNAEIARLKTQSPVEQLLQIGQAFERLEDSPAKTADQMAVFGRGYQVVLQLIKEGPEEFRKNIADAERLGQVWSGKTADAADALGDAVGRVGTALDGVLKRVVANDRAMTDLAGVADTLTDRIADFGRNIPDEQLDRLRTATVGATTAGAAFIAEVLEGVIRIAPSVISALGNISANVASVFAEWNRLKTLPALAAVEADLDVVSQKLRDHDKAMPAKPRGAGAVWDEGWDRWSAQRAELAARQAELLGVRSGLAPAPVRAAYGAPIGPDVPLGLYPAAPTPEQLAGVRGRATYTPGISGADAAGAAGKAAKEELGIVRDALAQELAAHQQNAGARLAIEQRYLAEIQARYGEHSDAYRDQLTRVLQAEQDAAEERRDLAQTALDEETDAQLAELDRRRQATEFAAQAGRLTKAQELAALQAYYDERFRILSEKLDREAVLTGDDPRAQARLGQQRTELGSQYAGDAQGLDQQRMQEQLKNAEQLVAPLFASVAQAGDRLTQGLVQGTLKWSAFFRQTLQQLGVTFAQTAVRMTLVWAQNQVAQAIATEVAEASKTEAAEEGSAERSAISFVEGLKNIYNSAVEAAGGAAAAVAKIPYVGAILAPIAAAATFAAVVGYKAFLSAEGGLGEVPAGGAFAQLHPKEMVLPASIAAPLRSALSSGSAPATAAASYTAINSTTVPSGKDVTKVSIASTQQPVPVTTSGREPITTDIKSAQNPIAVTGTGGAALPVKLDPNSHVEVTNPAGRPVFVHQVQMAGGMIAEVDSMGEGGGIGGGAGTGGGVSAAGGYDVPRDTRAKLHAREMVLPREHAETIRRLSGDAVGVTDSDRLAGDGGTGATIVNHIQFVDTAGAREFVQRYSREIGEAAIAHAQRRNSRRREGLRRV